MSTQRTILTTAAVAVVVLAMGLLSGTADAAATARTWVGSDNAGADGSFNTATFWAPTGVPVAGDTILIGNSTSSAGLATGTATILAGNAASVGILTLGNNLGDSGTLNLNGGTLTVTGAAAGSVNIGNNGTGTINVNSSGLLNFSGTTSTVPVKLGAGATGAGNLTIAPGGAVTIARAAGVTLGWLGVSGATGTVNQTGGTFTTSIGPIAVESGSYTLSGGTVYSAGTESVGTIKTATFTQTDGRNTFTNGLNVGVNAGTGTYSLSGGTLFGQRLAIAQNIAIGATEGTNGGSSVGTFLFGNSAGTGTIAETGGQTTHIGMAIRFDAAASGTFRGWGVVGLQGPMVNNGNVIADGYGTDRSLDMSSFASVDLNGTQTFANTTTNGWHAQDHGALILPALNVTGAGSYSWGGAGVLNRVNNVQLTFDSVTTPGALVGSLLSVDRTDVPTGLVDPIGVWSFTPTNLQFGTVSLAFRYDEAAAAALSLDESTLHLYHYDGTDWVLVAGTTLDTANNVLTATGLTSFSDYAIAESVVPEPATVSLLVLGGLGMLAARKRKR
jgi:fibronectin-binding autotransporter adhesin